MAGAVDRLGAPTTDNYERVVPLRARHDAEHPLVRRCRPLAMHIDGAAVPLLLPCEVVMILHLTYRLHLQTLADRTMHRVMTRRCKLAGEIHADPVFLSLLRLHGKPGEMAQIVRQRSDLLRELRIMIGDVRSDSPASRMRHDCEIAPRLDAECCAAGSIDLENSRVDEVVAAAACAELRGRLVLEMLQKPRRFPVGRIEHCMLPPVILVELRADAEAGLLPHRLFDLLAM